MSAQASGSPKISNHFCLMLVNVCSGLASNPDPLRDSTLQPRAREPPGHTVPVIVLATAAQGSSYQLFQPLSFSVVSWRTEP